MLAEDVEDYLGPIYSSEALFVIVIIGPDYPKRIWTKFESQHFKHRFLKGGVVPVVLSNVILSAFDITNQIGYFSIDIESNVDHQIAILVGLLAQKMAEHRQKSELNN